MAARAPGERDVTLRYTVRGARADWTLSEGLIPEARSHDLTIDLLKAILALWAAGSGRSIQVGRNLALRWDQARPNVGVDPDVYVVEPAPPEGDLVTSLCLWQTGHYPPLVAVEIVSATSPRKDYESAPERYAASGVGELWVFDPELAGPRSHGGPYELQVWARDDDGSFARRHAGDAPYFSRAIGAWLVAVDEGGRRLRIAHDAEGSRRWPTAEEAERAAKEEALRREQAERAAKEEALRRVAELEAKLRGR